MGDHVYHPDGALARLRNAYMRARISADWYDSLDWLYSGTGLEENRSF